MKLIVIACAVSLFACHASDATSDASDARLAGDVGGQTPDGGEAGDGGLHGDGGSDLDAGDTSLDHCATPISGVGPFGVKVRGTAEFHGGGTPDGGSLGEATVDLDLYFPEGFNPGAQVVAAHQSLCLPSLRSVTFALDEKKAGRFELYGAYEGYQDFDFDAEILSDGDGVVASVGGDFNSGSYNLTRGTAQVHLCPVGEPDPPTLVQHGEVTAPNKSIVFIPGAPMKQEDLSLTVSAGGASAPLASTIHDGLVDAYPFRMFSPGAASTVSPNGSVDIIGRAVTVAPVRLAYTTDSCDDLTFADAPVGGAVYGGTVRDGAVWWASNDTWYNQVLLVALGEREGSTMRVTLTMQCDDSTLKIPFSLLSETEIVTTTQIGCSPDAQIVTLEAAGKQRYWLVAVRTVEETCPYYSPKPRYPAVQLFVDEVVFE